MKLLSTKVTGVLIATEALALAFPPATWADVSTWKLGPTYGVPPKFDLEIWANASTNLTDAELFGGSLHPFAIADTAVDDDTGDPDIDAVANTLEVTAHPYVTGDGPVMLTTTLTLPGGTSLTASYWVIAVDADTIKLAASLSDAMAGTEVDLTSAGTGTLTIVDTADTERLHWHSEGLLGIAGDGAIALTNQKAYRERRQHRARALFYALAASLSASDPEWVSAAVYPMQDA